jgi:hypothetical protein
MLARRRVSLTIRVMIVPQFWAEARLQHRFPDRQITVRRFGWSDVSGAEAQSHAEQRAREALDRIAAGEKLPRREPRVGYNGAEGVPIREEIISRHGNTIITRNSYGALCLNTPDVMFVDVDEGMDSAGCLRGCVLFVLLGAGGFWLGRALGNWLFGLGFVALAALLAIWLAEIIGKIIIRRRGGHTAIARRQVDQLISDRPEWRNRLYRTPAGFRVLIMHRTFDPRGDEADEVFKAAEADEVSRIMCRSQNCFRARLTPKPWRIGMPAEGRPHRRSWPVPPETLAARAAWEREYERLSENYAACQFVGEYGHGPVHESARAVQALHDRLSKSESGLPPA